MIFQEILTDKNSRVKPLHAILAGQNPIPDICEHWDYIVREIDYYPIFKIARDILLSLSTKHTDTVRSLAATAQRIVAQRAALRHDLMGRVYHRLLADRKFLATYYTSIPAATILMKLALQPDRWDIDWSDVDRVGLFRITDLACGTGTLLMAAAAAVNDNFISASVAEKKKVETTALQKVLVESVISGYDVLPSAIHLTASTLALRAPETAFDTMNLFSLPLGGNDCRLGSIEFLKQAKVTTNIDFYGTNAAEQVGGKGTTKTQRSAEVLHPRDSDLVVMNPPFTRSVGGNLLFGSSPELERKQMQKNLQTLVRKHNVSASITAGLGSVFVAVADPLIRKNGRIALILPKALLSGVAWKKTRDLLKNYHIEYIVSSHDPLRWNFSDSTSLSEVLIVGRKVIDGKKLTNNIDHNGKTTIAVNLWHNPTTPFEANAAAYQILHGNPSDLETGQGAQELTIGTEKIGEVVTIPAREIATADTWLTPVAFAQSDLTRVAYHLRENTVWLPGFGKVGYIELCPLEKIASIGPDARDIHDGFRIAEKGTTSYPAFWSHDHDAVVSLSQSPNKYLSPLSTAKRGRRLKKVTDLWPLAGRIMIAERLWTKTQKTIAVRVHRRSLSNTWWPLKMKTSSEMEEHTEKALTLWLNSSLGIVMMLANRVETRGAWMKFKKPTLASMPILDFMSISHDQLTYLSTLYDEVSELPLQQFPMIAVDEVRKRIDDGIAHALSLPDCSVIRELLAKEPIISLNRL